MIRIKSVATKSMSKYFDKNWVSQMCFTVIDAMNSDATLSRLASNETVITIKVNCSMLD